MRATVAAGGKQAADADADGETTSDEESEEEDESDKEKPAAAASAKKARRVFVLDGDVRHGVGTDNADNAG